MELSGGTTAVRTLGLFELDDAGVELEHFGTFTHPTIIMGKEYEVEFNYKAFKAPPEKPDADESTVVENSKLWWKFQNYYLYQAAMLHEKRKLQAISQYQVAVKDYILKNAVSNPNAIITQADWIKVYRAALIEPLTMEKITATLRNTYKAKFDGDEIFDALAKINRDSEGEYDTIRWWENKLMVEMQLTDLEYGLLSVDERARKVCTLFLDDIMTYLQMEVDSAASKANKKAPKR